MKGDFSRFIDGIISVSPMDDDRRTGPVAVFKKLEEDGEL